MYTQEVVKKVQKRLLDMAVVIRDILEAHQIPYFITYGTLLGAVRHKGFIPWDDDFDLYLFDDSYDLAMKVLRKDLPSDLFLEDKESEPLFFHGWSHVKDLHSLAECELFPDDGKYAHKGISVDLYKTKKIYEKEEQVYRLKEHLDYLHRKHYVGIMRQEEFIVREYEINKKLLKEREILNCQKNLGREMYAFNLIYDDRLYIDEMFPLKRYPFENTEFYGPKNADALLSRCYGDYMQLPPEEKRHPHYSKVEFLNK